MLSSIFFPGIMLLKLQTITTNIVVSDLTTALAAHNIPMPVCRYEVLITYKILLSLLWNR